MDVPTYGGEEDDEAQRLINEEYKTWKKNAPFLYDMILRYATTVSLDGCLLSHFWDLLLTELLKYRPHLADSHSPMVPRCQGA